MDAPGKLTLDRGALKVLASDTRLDLLKALDERQKTVTELAREVNLNKATVFEHLDKLREAGLVQRLDDGRKWVYWQLSWKGRRLLHPGATSIALLLASSLGAAVTAVVAYVLYLRASAAAILDGPLGDDGGGRESAPGTASPTAEPVSGGPGPADAAALAEPLLYAAVALGVLTLLLIVGAYAVHRRRRVAAPASAAA